MSITFVVSLITTQVFAQESSELPMDELERLETSPQSSTESESSNSEIEGTPEKIDDIAEGLEEEFPVESENDFFESSGYSSEHDSSNKVEIKTDDTKIPRKTNILKYSHKEIKAACTKYNNNYIAYYDNVFFVKKCKRYKVSNINTLFNLQKNNTKFIKVKADIIAKIPKSKHHYSFFDKASKKSLFNCNKFHNTYVTFNGSNIYFIQKCKLRKFPNWSVYQNHRRKFKNQKIQYLDQNNLQGLTFAKDMSDSNQTITWKKSRIYNDTKLDILSQQDACVGINNSIVSYYSKLYKIKNCKKYEIKNNSKITKAPIEISSQVWLSLPNINLK